MRIKVDENVSPRALSPLRALGYDVDTAVDEGLGGRSDAEVWRATQDSQRFLITQDLDFSDTRRFSPGTHCGILLIRLPDREQPRIAEYLAAWFGSEDSRSWARCMIVATPSKVRVMRPPES